MKLHHMIPVMDFIAITSFALFVIIALSYWQQSRQLAIYEDFTVKCLNGNWVVNGGEAVLCIKI